MKMSKTFILLGLVMSLALSQQHEKESQAAQTKQHQVEQKAPTAAELKLNPRMKKSWWKKKLQNAIKIFKPKINLPKINIPSIPKIVLPKINLPKINIPSIPKINLPKINIPKIDLPKINLPKINIPKIDLPKINLPKINLPNLLKINIPKILGDGQVVGAKSPEQKGDEKKKDKKKEEKKDIDEDDENVKKKGDESSDRHYCDLVMKKNDIKVEIDKKMINMKFLKGKITIVATRSSGDKECQLLDVAKCSSTSRNVLTRSSYFKVVNMNEHKVRFGFHFFVGINREMGLCSVRVAMKNSKDKFEDREKVMSYFPSDKFDVSKFDNQESFGSSHDVFEGMTTQQALEMCAAPFEKTQKMLISNFYQTFEGFMLSESQAEETKFKCEKNIKQNDVLFRANNEAGLKKVDVFVNNKEYTHIAIKSDQTKVKITEKKMEEAKKGGNVPNGVKAFSFQVYGLSYYNFQNNQCYDLDRKNVAKSWVKSSYNPSVSDNNSEFTFDVVVMAEEGVSGTLCTVYGLYAVPAEDDKLFIQNDMLVKFKMGDESITNDNCATMLQDLTKHNGKMEMYNSVENRYLGGAIINSLANPEHKLYCQIDVRDNIARDQFRQDQYNRIFYETAVVQFVDNNNEEQVNSAIAAQIEAAQKRIESFQEIQSVLPSFHSMPYDLMTKQEVMDVLPAGQTLENMDFMKSQNGLFAAIMKSDNKLCIYLIQSNDGETQKIWCSPSEASEAGKGVLKLTEAGELSIQDSATQAVIYSACGAGAGEGFFLMMQNDGNLVVYNSENVATWSSDTYQNNNYFKLDSTLINHKASLKHINNFGMVLRSPNKKFLLILDQTGGLEIRKKSKDEPTGVAIWGNSAELDVQYKFTMHLELQENGNLVQYSEEGQNGKVWETNTPDKGITHMEITDLGALNLISASGSIIWFDGMMPNNLWTGPAQNVLKQGDSLNAQQFLRSENARFVAILKDDLSLVVYLRKEDGKNEEIYNNNQKSNGQNLGTLSVNEKGAVVVTDNTENKVLFTSPTKSSGSLYHLRMQNNGRLVSYDENYEVQWETDEVPFKTQTLAAIPFEVAAPFTSFSGNFLMSANKKCMMQLEQTGAISITDDAGKIHWSSMIDIGKNNLFTKFVSLANDGEFSMYVDENTQQWTASDSKQLSPDGFKLSLSDACVAEIKNSKGEVTWNPIVMKKTIFTSGPSKIQSGGRLDSNECLNDYNNMYAACMMPNGDLEISQKMDTKGTPKKLWNSATTCDVAGACILQFVNDNVEIYDLHNKKQIKLLKNGKGGHVIMQNDGNFVFYDESDSAKWATMTNISFQAQIESSAYPNRVVKTHKWQMGGIIMASPNKKYVLIYQFDGNLVVYQQQKATQISNGPMKGKEQFLILQNDGNFVLYENNSKANWAAASQGGSALELLDSGELKVTADDGSVKWSKQFNSRRLQNKKVSSLSSLKKEKKEKKEKREKKETSSVSQKKRLPVVHQKKELSSVKKQKVL